MVRGKIQSFHKVFLPVSIAPVRSFRFVMDKPTMANHPSCYESRGMLQAVCRDCLLSNKCEINLSLGAYDEGAIKLSGSQNTTSVAIKLTKTSKTNVALQLLKRSGQLYLGAIYSIKMRSINHFLALQCQFPRAEIRLKAKRRRKISDMVSYLKVGVNFPAGKLSV